jgi:hypothetical protein
MERPSKLESKKSFEREPNPCHTTLLPSEFQGSLFCPAFPEINQKLLDNKDQSINNLAHELLAIVISSVIPAKAGIQNYLKIMDSAPRLACVE